MLCANDHRVAADAHATAELITRRAAIERGYPNPALLGPGRNVARKDISFAAIIVDTGKACILEKRAHDNCVALDSNSEQAKPVTCPGIAGRKFLLLTPLSIG